MVDLPLCTARQIASSTTALIAKYIFESFKQSDHTCMRQSFAYLSAGKHRRTQAHRRRTASPPSRFPVQSCRQQLNAAATSVSLERAMTFGSHTSIPASCPCMCELQSHDGAADRDQVLQIATSSVARAVWCGSGVMVDGKTEWSGAEVAHGLVCFAAIGC